ncbi:transposase [Haloimpatiens sp. FM7315]|uniref:transposase n=1 Tax=Haloimpatiens sp. FM7315 TaxID=3298609 RepID=UPI0035A3C9D6
MPRTQRIKNEAAIYHVMVRSIKELALFKKDKDKVKYLSQLKYYKTIYGFKVYAYCIMNNHAHFIIDANGADISKIMHGLNFKYATAYNKEHNRYGHLFQDRFKSKIVDTDRYLLTLSAYIHNNPIKIKGYEKCPYKYKYSSLGVYLGLEKDKTGLLDEAYIMRMFGNNVNKARENYMKFVCICDEEKLKKEIEFEDENTEYRSERSILLRNFDPKDVLDFISEETGVEKIMFYVKNNRKNKTLRALAVVLMRSLCNCKCKDICKILGNITEARVSKLCYIGVKVIESENKYKDIINRFILQQHKNAS